MTVDRHPITPPPELVQQWTSLANEGEGYEVWSSIALWAAQWGADQELEACCKWLEWWDDFTAACQLRAARRPKPPTLKEQALNDLDDIPTHDDEGRQVVDLSNIRRALEALPQ